MNRSWTDTFPLTAPCGVVRAAAPADGPLVYGQYFFLEALMKKAISPGVYLNPFTAIPFGSTAASSITVDKGTSLWDLYQVAQALKSPLTTTVPIANANYETTNAGDAVQWDRTQALQLFNDLAQDKPVPASLISGTQVG